MSAQQLSTFVTDDLPDAPGRDSAPQTAGHAQKHTPQAAAISGTVYDSSGALLPNAQIVLTSKDGGPNKTISADSAGNFQFSNLPPGVYQIKVTFAGMGDYASQEMTLASGEQHEALKIVLPVASTHADVVVSVTMDELAEEQIRIAEKQRVLGVLPNFYSSYEANPAPLKAKQKFELALKSTTDPISFLTAGFAAGVEQATNAYKGYGQGAQGYGKRYGAAYGDDVIDRMMGSAILPSIFHQDPRYFYKGTGTTRERLIYALKSAIVCKGDNGQWQPNYSHVLGNFIAGGISNLYYPSENRGAWLTIRNGLLDTAGNAGANALREFLLKRLTPNAPDDAQAANP